MVQGGSSPPPFPDQLGCILRLRVRYEFLGGPKAFCIKETAQTEPRTVWLIPSLDMLEHHKGHVLRLKDSEDHTAWKENAVIFCHCYVVKTW